VTGSGEPVLLISPVVAGAFVPFLSMHRRWSIAIA
jgi:hypothetical protein